MDRGAQRARFAEPCDVLVIGGGATGLGTALDSASRGYRTLLVEGGDFAGGTSSRSTKLIHGGVRYLRQGNLSLVRDGLRERTILLANAPAIVRPRRFLLPIYRPWELPYYRAGLGLYDLLAGRRGLAHSRLVRRHAAMDMVPGLDATGLVGGVTYQDGQFDDARLALALAKGAAQRGAGLLNHAHVTSLIHHGDAVRGAIVQDRVSGGELRIAARCTINATGVHVDTVRRLDDPDAASMIVASRGTHLVLDASFLGGETAVLVPRTPDGRVVFLIPWHGRALLGTTDVPVDDLDGEPVPSEHEIDYLLTTAGRYLTVEPRREDVLTTFAGLRPLLRGSTGTTSGWRRDHRVITSASGLVTVAGGKWTTYRRMAQDAVDRAAQVASLPSRPCTTSAVSLAPINAVSAEWGELGATPNDVEMYAARFPGTMHPALPYSWAMAAYAVEREMPVHLDDLLARRLRALPLSASAALACAPEAARLMADLQGHGTSWIDAELSRFRLLAASSVSPL